MYITSIPNRNSLPANLLRESYREDGKIKTRTQANVTNWQPEVIAASDTAKTIDDALVALSRLTYLHYESKGVSVTRLPRPDPIQTSILSALGLTFEGGSVAKCRQ